MRKISYMLHADTSILLLLPLSCLLITASYLLMTTQMTISSAEAHLEHLPHYNSGGSRYGYGDYKSFMALEPEYGTTEYPTLIEFSIQDFDNNDVHNIMTMVEIYESSSGTRIHMFPWTFRDVGDFLLYYQFPNKGNYQIVLSINNTNNTSKEGAASYFLSSATNPQRSMLGDVSDCNCTRTVFNITIASSFGDVRNIVYVISIVFPITLLGIVLTKNYLRRSSKTKRIERSKRILTDQFDVTNMGNDSSKIDSFTRKQNIKYYVTLLALAGGLVHLVVFPEHGSVHIYYTIFLLSAAGAQVAYGILYFLIVLSKPFYELSNIQEAKSAYKNNILVNLFGFIGTIILVGLYAYSVINPPPLSPINEPEEIEIAGVLAKSLEIALLVGISFIIKWDREAFGQITMNIRRNARS